MSLKSERLKKLENELADLEQWLKLSLVPKKDITKHKEEIETIKKKIHDEKERLRFLRESGEVEEYTPPKRTARPVYQEPQSMPDMGMGVSEGSAEGSFDTESESYNAETSTGETTTSENTAAEEENSSQVYEDEDPFSDKNRWKRGILEDPDVDEW